MAAVGVDQISVIKRQANIPLVNIPEGTNRGNGAALAAEIMGAMKNAFPETVHPNCSLPTRG